MKKKLYLALLVTLTTACVLTGYNGCNTTEVVEENPEVVSEEVPEDITSEETTEETDTTEEAEPTTEEVTETSETVQEEVETSETEETGEATSEPATEEITETASEDVPAYTVTDMEKTMYAQRSVNVRTGPGTEYDKLGALNTNDEVKVTGQADNGWYRIEYKGNEGFVSDNYLGDAKVVVNTTPVIPENNGTTTTTPEATTPTVDTTNVATRVVNGDTRYAFRTTANGTPIYDGIDWQWPQYIVDIINECCTPNMSDYEKAQAIYNWMGNNITYDNTYKSYTTNSTLSLRVATCTGYSNTFQTLCCTCGISTSVAEGWRDSTSHAWNFLYIDGNRYYVDRTASRGFYTNIVFTNENDTTLMEVYDPSGQIQSRWYMKYESWDGIMDAL